MATLRYQRCTLPHVRRDFAGNKFLHKPRENFQDERGSAGDVAQTWHKSRRIPSLSRILGLCCPENSLIGQQRNEAASTLLKSTCLPLLAQNH